MKNWYKNIFVCYTHNELIRFVVVGLMNTLFGYTVFAFFIFVGLRNSVAVGLAVAVNVLFNFKTIGILVFRNRNNLLILKFLLAYLIIYLVYLNFLNFLTSLNLGTYVAGAILTVPIALLSFVLNKMFVFKESKGDAVDTIMAEKVETRI